MMPQGAQKGEPEKSARERNRFPRSPQGSGDNARQPHQGEDRQPGKRNPQVRGIVRGQEFADGQHEQKHRPQGKPPLSARHPGDGAISGVEYLHKDDGSSNAHQGVENRQVIGPHPIHARNPPVNAQGTQVHPGRVKKRAHHQPLLVNPVSETEQQQTGPGLAPADGQFSGDNRSAAVKHRQGEKGQRVDKLVQRRGAGEQFTDDRGNEKEDQGRA